MRSHCWVMIGAMLVAACSSTPTETGLQAERLAYPKTPASAHADVYHGRRIADPYRWLEQESTEQTRQWISAQNALAQPYLEGIPARARIQARLKQLWNYERFELPVKRGGRYFWLRNDGLQSQSVLYVADGLQATPRVLLDPNTFSADGTIAMAEFEPSPDGKLVAYSVSDAGTDWRIWRIRDVERGTDLPEELRFIKFATVAWTPDSKSLYYARYPQRPDGSGDDAKQRQVFRHVLGEPVARDRLIFAVTDHPTRNPYVEVSDDGRYLIYWLYDGAQQTGVYHQRLNADGAPIGDVVRLFDAFDASYLFVGVIDDVFYVHTNKDAPNGRVLAVPADDVKHTRQRIVVPESTFALESASIVGRRLFAQYLQDVRSVVHAHDLEGQKLYEVKLPGLGQASGFGGDVEDTETFFAYTDYLTPLSISRLDVASGAVSLFRAPTVQADLTPYLTEQVFYRSKDGTRVPMFITRRRDLPRDGQAPTLLYGYGGFNIAQQPAFSVPMLVWLEMGGVYAVANLRGGSEYGEAWHSAGTKLNKQNVFDDFIAAAEFLIRERYTSTPRLAIRGRSNGGLLVGAVMTQRPELFGAALPAVGVLDMLRYHTASGNARQWATDYGLSESEAEFQAQLAYSPVHNVRDGVCYPPTLITTADRDDRVVPWHSYKFAAALQHAQDCANPILLRVETRAGHGAGKPVWMQIEDFADQWAFLVATLGMQTQQGARPSE